MTAEREKEATQAWAAINDELRKNCETLRRRHVAHLVQRWILTRSPTYMDHVTTYCEYRDIPLTKTVRKYLAECAEQRIGAGITRPQAESLKDQALMTIANMVFHGATLTAATEKAALALGGFTRGSFELKASTLEKEYTERYRKSGLEKTLFSGWQDLGPGEWDEFWREIIDQPTDINDELKGERR